MQKHNSAPSPRRSTERDPYGRERGNRIPLPACYDKVTALEGGIVFVSQKFDRKIKEKIQKTTSCTYSSHCHERYMQDVLCQVSLWSSSQAKGGSSDALDATDIQSGGFQAITQKRTSQVCALKSGENGVSSNGHNFFSMQAI